ncbi:MAG: LPS export ABC transporter periplasmic protein LptC [Acidobacteriota bacterium]
MAFRRQRLARYILIGALGCFACVIGVLLYRGGPHRGKATVISQPQGKSTISAEWKGIDFVRTEGDRKLFQVKAAEHYLDDKGYYRLRGGVQITIFGKEKDEITLITSDGGYYDRDFMGLFLEGNVKAKLANGLKMSTDSLRYVKDKDLIRSSEAVKFERGDVSGRGNGLSIDVTEKVLEFLHRAEFDVKNIRSDLAPLTQIRSRYMLYNDRGKFGIFQDGVEVTNAGSHLMADEVEFALTEDGEHLKDLDARIGVQAEFKASSRGSTGPAEGEGRNLSSIASGPGDKILTADKAHLVYTPDGRHVAEAVATGNALVEVLRKKDDKVTYRRRIRGDVLHFFFFKDKDGIERCEAQGKVSVEIFQEGKSRKEGVDKKVWCDTLSAVFDPLTEEASHMEFSGNVRFQDREATAFGGKGTYDGPRKLLVITEGNPRVEREGSTVTGKRIEISEDSGALRAIGEAKTAFARRGGEISFFGNADEPVYLSGENMTYDPNKGVAVYTPDARAWQGDNVITAAEITVDQSQNTFSGSTGVKSVLFTSPPKKAGEPNPAKGEKLPITVTSDKLLYTEQTRTMKYTSNVVMHREEADMRSDACEVFFQKKENDVDKMVSTGNVVITQPGRQIFGDNANYDVPADSVTLTGKPKVIDGLRGTSQGKTLTYFFGTGKIILDGQLEGRTTTIYEPEPVKR